MFIPEKDNVATHKKMIALYDKATKHYLSENDSRFAGICLIHQGFDRFMLRDYGQSIENMIRGDELLKSIGYSGIPMIGKYLHDMALVFYFFGEYEKVAELMETAMRFPPVDYNRGIQRYNNLGLAYLHLDQKQKAKNAFLMIIEEAKSAKDGIWIALGSKRLADIYLKEGKYREALDLYGNSLSFIDKNHFIREYSEHILGLAKCHILLGNILESKKYIAQANQVALLKDSYYFGERQQDEKYWIAYYDVKHLYFLKTHEYEKAYHYQDSLNILKRTQDSVYNSLQIHLAQQRLHIQKNLSEIETAKQEKEILSARAWTISTGTALLTVIFVLLFYIGRIKRKKDKEEYLNKEQKMRNEEKRLNHELESLKIQMDHHLEKIKESNLLIKQYKSETTADDAKIDIENLKILTKEHWEDFIGDFKKVHKRFYVKITKTYPYLTSSELRLVLLLKLGINQKELPRVLGTSDVNIRVTMHRLRQKIAQNGTGVRDKEINTIVGLL